jgi:hypothetical protein
MCTIKNPTFTFDLTQIQMVPSNADIFLFKTTRTSNMGLKLS